jgi:hypothetical protein
MFRWRRAARGLILKIGLSWTGRFPEVDRYLTQFRATEEYNVSAIGPTAVVLVMPSTSERAT